jgi:DNA polymerase-3 subunit delta
VDTGATSAARKDQENLLKELVQKTLAGFGKKLEPQALPVLLDRVGFHPNGVVMETEKLALASESDLVTLAELNDLVGRTREEALYELNEAVGNRDLEGALISLVRLEENGLNPLVIVAGLRNFFRKLLLVRALVEAEHPAYNEGISYPAFQKGYLPRLKSAFTSWPSQLAGHPFVVYKAFQQAERFSMTRLEKGFKELLACEYRLKGSRLPDYLILEAFLFDLLASKRAKTLAEKTG